MIDNNQKDVVKLYKAVGCKVYSTAHSTHRRIRGNDPGIPDLLVFLRSHFWFQEVKSEEGGKRRLRQREFSSRCANAGIVCLTGGIEVAREHLRALGVILP
jgi:hypothetical protein